jgi:aminoglycoside 6'-N-acetyltransferase
MFKGLRVATRTTLKFCINSFTLILPRPVTSRSAISGMFFNYMAELISDGELSIRLMRDELDDYQVMAKWLSDPRVLEFYEGRDHAMPLDQIQAEYAPHIRGEDDVAPCLIILESAPIGYLQFYRVGEDSRNSYGLAADYDLESVYGIDQFIGEVSCWNRGLGTRSVLLLLRYLFQTKGARRVILDPHVTNLRAIRCYEKCGFRKVKILRAHEMHEGVLRDVWLMEASSV